MTEPYIQTDYRREENWLCCPHQALSYPADVFYLCPTGYIKTPKGPMTCTVDNRGMRLRLQEHLEHCASAFATAGNFFAPYYRQASVECLLNLQGDHLQAFADGPVTDILNAFHYYIRHFNQGRPFILAGHSQGSILMQAILSDYFKTYPKVQKRMIAAYCIGFSVTEDFMTKNPHLSFAEGRRDTGCIISFNTEAPGYEGPNITLLPNALVINPISWTRDESLAPASQSLGSHLVISFNTEAPGYEGPNITLLPNALVINPISWTRDESLAPASQSLGSHLVIRDAYGRITRVEDRLYYANARLDLARGVVVCSTADPALLKIYGLESFFDPKVLHAGDYALYYYDLRKNAEDRVDAWFKTH